MNRPIAIRGVHLTKEHDDLIVELEIDGTWVEIARDDFRKLGQHFILSGWIRKRAESREPVNA